MSVNIEKNDQGRQLLLNLLRKGNYIFDMRKIKQTAGELGISEAYLPELLRRLVECNWIIRLKRGLYASDGNIIGTTDIHPFVMATNLFTPSAVSHWSAMHHWGFTEQVPNIVTVMTTCKVMTPAMRRGAGNDCLWETAGTRCRFIKVHEDRWFGIMNIWVDERFQVPIVDPERTVLELFIDPGAFGGITEALSVIEENVAGIDIEKLMEYAVVYGKAAPAARLGWVLEKFGIDGKILDRLAGVIPSYYAPLEPGKPHRGKCSSRWKIIENIGINRGCHAEDGYQTGC
ncbi:MAG: type IV toxin-antitoxin system AbiEi family antitoxin domain-containing protein [Candidatus Cloacimonetes bacterium]|nr:type IV toxin-antitoxin system AbiEi family antitoxin domain-containing protein [Candidatus Cloacimonadota bacterium]